MLYRLMRECRNYFPIPTAAIAGIIEIKNGAVCGLELLPGQYYIVEGSTLNNGLHQQFDALTDETFSGYITPLAVPKAFIELAERISEWEENNGTPSPYQSESFGGYTYQRASGRNGGQMTWQDAFYNEIKAWKKV